MIYLVTSPQFQSFLNAAARGDDYGEQKNAGGAASAGGGHAPKAQGQSA